MTTTLLNKQDMLDGTFERIQDCKNEINTLKEKITIIQLDISIQDDKIEKYLENYFAARIIECIHLMKENNIPSFKLLVKKGDGINKHPNYVEFDVS